MKYKINYYYIHCSSCIKNILISCKCDFYIVYLQLDSVVPCEIADPSQLLSRNLFKSFHVQFNINRNFFA